MYRLPTILLAILVMIALILVVVLIGRNKGAAPSDPCFQSGERRIRIIYLARRPAGKAREVKGCALCDADNANQWNALYRVFGGREDIEFVIILPKGSESQRDRVLRHDLSITGNEAVEEDKVVVCDRGIKRLDHTGVIDMAFIREVYAVLAQRRETGP